LWRTFVSDQLDDQVQALEILILRMHCTIIVLSKKARACGSISHSPLSLQTPIKIGRQNHGLDIKKMVCLGIEPRCSSANTHTAQDCGKMWTLQRAIREGLRPFPLKIVITRKALREGFRPLPLIRTPKL
jgi:hypothetical protein